MPYSEVSAGGVSGKFTSLVRYEKADTSGKLMPGPNDARMNRKRIEKVSASETVMPRLERQYAGGAGQFLGKEKAMTAECFRREVPCRVVPCRFVSG
jgi:hypothetical protein